ncbi:hypothetical protein PUN28_000303 [Cardiocondyla obscurior]|uniref:C2H2-type domain-containing protein n=1 Tax=Cardiocondyla obscurior TaxID=286306 RepID=A0AAW2GYV7_9HYME
MNLTDACSSTRSKLRAYADQIHDFHNGRELLKQPKRLRNPKDSGYDCKVCKKSYANYSSLRRHIKSECINKAYNPCSYCNYSSTQRGNTKRHERNVHKKREKERGLQLQPIYVSRSSNVLTCRSFYFSDPALHVMTDYYKRLGRHFCSKCGKEYKWMQSLIRHKREECGKDPQYTCTICGLKIRHKWQLKKHMINVHRLVIPNGKNI